MGGVKGNMELMKFGIPGVVEVTSGWLAPAGLKTPATFTLLFGPGFSLSIPNFVQIGNGGLHGRSLAGIILGELPVG